MDEGWVAIGIFFIFIGIFATLVPELGLLAPGELYDLRIATLCFVGGILFLLLGLISKKEKKE